MNIRVWIKKIIGVYDYDREAEKLIKKSIFLYHKGGKVNCLRSIRLYNKIRKDFCCNIFPGIEVGEGFYIAHAHDVCIGRTAIIGKNCRIYPHSDITASVKNDKERWNNHMRRHAKIGDDCIIGNGAVIVGPVTIGNDVTIGACAIITKDVPSHMVVKNTNQFRQKRIEEIPEQYKSNGKVIETDVNQSNETENQNFIKE